MLVPEYLPRNPLALPASLQFYLRIFFSFFFIDTALAVIRFIVGVNTTHGLVGWVELSN